MNTEAEEYVEEIMRHARRLAERNGLSIRDVLEAIAEGLPESRRSELLGALKSEERS